DFCCAINYHTFELTDVKTILMKFERQIAYMQEKPFNLSPLRFSWKCRSIAFAMLGLAIILAGVVFALPRLHPARAAEKGYTVTAGDWPMYMHDVGRSGYNKAETIINPASAPNLKVRWTNKGGGVIFSQPVVANGIIYWGSFDGYEHATNLN